MAEYKPLTEEQLEKLTKEASDASMGYNTMNLGPRYATAVKRLLEEREHWVKQLQQATRAMDKVEEDRAELMALRTDFCATLMIGDDPTDSDLVHEVERLKKAERATLRQAAAEIESATDSAVPASAIPAPVIEDIAHEMRTRNKQ